jgi:hypothetical protein
VPSPVVLVLHQVAERVPHGRRLEKAGRELVEERLEGVVVVPVDEHDVDVRAPERAGCADAGEASSEHEDAGTGRAARLAHLWRMARFASFVTRRLRIFSRVRRWTVAPRSEIMRSRWPRSP